MTRKISSMSQFAALSTLEHPTHETQVPEATAQLPMQNLEDQHLAERVEHALHARGHFALYSTRVSVRARVVFLEGRVPSYYLKQLAQETARVVPGAHQIRNDLRVVQLHEDSPVGDAMPRQPHVRFRVPPAEQSSDTDGHRRFMRE
jgi:osmotically-inducible protein OsmY